MYNISTLRLKQDKSNSSVSYSMNTYATGLINPNDIPLYNLDNPQVIEKMDRQRNQTNIKGSIPMMEVKKR